MIQRDEDSQTKYIMTHVEHELDTELYLDCLHATNILYLHVRYYLGLIRTYQCLTQPITDQYRPQTTHVIVITFLLQFVTYNTSSTVGSGNCWILVAVKSISGLLDTGERYQSIDIAVTL